MRRDAPLIAMAVTALATGCVVEGEGPPPLRATLEAPSPGGAHPATDAVRVRFDRYLDPGTDWQRAAALASGTVTVEATVGYDPVGPALVVVPAAELRVGLGYTLTVDAAALRGIDDSRLDEDLRLDFVASNPRAPDRPDVQVDFERDVAPVLALACTCHGPAPGGDYPVLTPAGLVEQPSHREAGALLVVPGDPLRSALVRKVLPDYPAVRGASMPPGGALPDDDLRRIVTWIERL